MYYHQNLDTSFLNLILNGDDPDGNDFDVRHKTYLVKKKKVYQSYVTIIIKKDHCI